MLKELFSKIDLDMFQEIYHTQDCYHFQGLELPKLVTWSDLNAVLQNDLLDFPRLRICGDSNSLSNGYSGFMRYRASSTGAIVPTINKHILQRALREGNTLIIDSAQSYFQQVKLAANELSSVFKCAPTANIYASWTQTPSFGMHFDDHGVLAYQLYGEKIWEIHKPTFKDPLSGEKSFTHERPACKPDYKVALKEGEALYVPAGFWHNVVTTDKQSLHITFGLNRPRRIDVFHGIAKLLTQEDYFREELPLTLTLKDAIGLQQALINKLKMIDFLTLTEAVDTMYSEPRQINNFELPNIFEPINESEFYG